MIQILDTFVQVEFRLGVTAGTEQSLWCNFYYPDELKKKSSNCIQSSIHQAEGTNG